MVVNQDFVLNVPDNISLAGAAPLMCAGITVRHKPHCTILCLDASHVVKALHVVSMFASLASSLSAAHPVPLGFCLTCKADACC